MGETLQPKPFSTIVNGKEYFLCVKQDGEKQVYFFTTSIDNLAEGQKQTQLPNNYEVSISSGFPLLVKNSD